MQVGINIHDTRIVVITGNLEELSEVGFVLIISIYISFCVDDAGITILLALSVYQMIVNEKLPATSDAVPLLGNV